MSNKKAQPFTISRTNSSKSSFSFLDKSLSNSFEENTDANIMPELLEQYTQANLYYRDEEFSQQAETFITKIAQDKKIPKEYRAKFPLYQILVSLCKIFMLNEYEIITFSCTLDHCSWKIDEVILPEEASYLEEFPANFGGEISDECKRFIMYLLIVAFSLKQYLNDKSEIDPIQAYCEKICDNFQILFNRWTRQSSLQKFNYSAPEINRKYKTMSKKEYSDRLSTPKDYNMMADQIMAITGSYASKGKQEAPTPPAPQPKPKAQPQPQLQPKITSQLSQIFSEFAPQSINLPKPSYPEGTERTNKGFSRQHTFESIEDLARIPTNRGPLQRQDTLSQLLTNFSALRRQESFDLFDKGSKKKVKWDNDGDNKDRSNINSQNDEDEVALPTLSKKASNISQQDDFPSFSRLNSNLSFLYEK